MKHLLITIICLLVPMLANAKYAVIDGGYYDLDIYRNREAEVISGNGLFIAEGGEGHDGIKYSGEVIIPNNVNYNGYTYPVVGIREGAFFECWDLTSVTIGNNVTYIGNHAFFKCYGLTSIILPNSVKAIDPDAFSCCTNLQTIIIGNGLTDIGINAFTYCSNLKNFYCLSTTVPETYMNNKYNSFSGFPIENATLYVPEESVWLYERHSQWSDFGTIVGLKVKEIDEIIMDANPVFNNNNVKESLRFMLDGKRIGNPQKGINIVKMSDGTTRKVMVK